MLHSLPLLLAFVPSLAGAGGDPADLLGVVRRYADVMIEKGRDDHGRLKSPLFLGALDRHALAPLAARPAHPAGIRREDRVGLPWRPLTGANPHHDENLLRVLYALTDLTGERRYAEAADAAIRWFFENARAPATGLLAWGEHLSWDVFLDRPISGSTDLTHEFARPWALWDRTHELAPEAARRFALGLWEHQVADHETGAFDRHAPFDRHGPQDGKDFPRHAGFYIDTWAHAYSRTRDPTFLRAIEVVLARFERRRAAGPGGPRSTIGPIDTAAAAPLVPEPLSGRLARFAGEEDRLVLEELRREHGAPGGSWRFRPTWEAAYGAGIAADWAMLAIARYERAGKREHRELILAIADSYRDELPGEDVDLWPMSLAHVISAEAAAWRISGRTESRGGPPLRPPGAGGLLGGPAAPEGELPLRPLRGDHRRGLAGPGPPRGPRGGPLPRHSDPVGHDRPVARRR